jgi:dihydrofolate reductase
MRLVVSQFMSLDGVVQAPGGPDEDTDGGFSHGGWSMPWFDPEVMGGAIDATMTGTDALLFGRRTWQTMATAWPERSGDDDPFTDRMNSITKYVVSSTLTDDDLTWTNSHLVPADGFLDAVRDLKARPGDALSVMGSTQLSTALVSAGLVDEYLLMIEPVLLGGGKRIFPADGELRALELASVEQSNTGVLVCRYRPGEMPPMPTWD